MKALIFLILITIFAPPFTTANHLPPHLKFWRINELNGLQVSTVNDIKQDQLGFIWIASNDGLYRYDGQKFLAFRYEVADSRSLPNNNVSRLFFDSKGDFWILTDHGIAQYNYATNDFLQITNKSNEDLFTNLSFTDIAESNEGVYYLSTYGGGIRVYKNGEFFPLNSNPDFSLTIRTIYLQDDTILWIGSSQNGLQKYNLSSGALHHYSEMNNDVLHANTVYTIYEDSKKNIWVGTSDGLIAIPSKSGPFKISKGDITNFSDNKVLSVFEDHSQRVWIGTGENGLMMAPLGLLLTEKEKSVFTIYEPSENLNTLSYRTINCIYQDRSNNIWLGTYHHGLNVFMPDGEKVTTYSHYASQPNSLPHSRVWGVCEDFDGNIWIGTDGNGISKLNPFTGKFEHFPFQNGLPSGPNDKAILTAICDRNNNIWFGTYLGGVSLFMQETKTFRHFCINPDGSSVFNQNDIRAIHEANNGTIWAGSNRGGLYYFDERLHNFKSINQWQELDIRAITSDSDGVLWLGTYGNGGLFSYDPYKNEFGVNSLENEILNATPVILTLCLTSDSILWLGSQYFGLIRVNTKTLEKKFYTTADGLAHNSIRTIIQENENTIWLATDIGISSFNIKTEEFNNYSITNGLLPGAFNDNSGFLSANGYLAFGCGSGLNLFYPNDLITSNKPSSIVFTDFKLYNKSFVPEPGKKNNPINKSIWIEDIIHLQHYQNVFTLDFVALEYPFSNGWNYEYLLENYDRDWNNVGELNSSTYRNLPPGEYTFRVRVAGKSNEMRGHESIMNIIVYPPWWKTNWAYGIWAFIMLSLTWMILRFRTKQINLRNSLYYEKKIRQQEQTLSEEKLRFYTNFSHELKTPLSLILGPSKDLYDQNPRPDQISKVDIIRRNANYLMELFNKLMQFRKIESSKIILNISKSNINVLLKQEVEYFEFQAKQKNVLFTSEITGDQEGWADFISLQIILNNLLSNAVKFTSPGGEIFFKASNERGKLVIQVSNSGNSLSDNEKKLIFAPFYQGKNSVGHGGTGIGLTLCKNLVELHNGNIAITTTHQKIITFIVKIPVLKENYQTLEHVRYIDDFLQTANSSEKQITINQTYSNTPAEDEKLILLVDDNNDIIEYLHDILNPEYSIISANDGITGIETAKSRIPDLIIADVMMPQKTGIELCQELKTDIKTSHIPIILLTAKDTNESKIEGFEKGADDYISKPFDSSVLCSKINSLFHNRHLLRNYFRFDFKSQETEGKLSIEEEFLKKLETCILLMYENNNEISVPELCKEMGFSRTSLYRKVKAISDLSINQIIRSVKLRKSAELMKHSGMTISEIAFELGFNDQKYFRKCFKEQFGMTPSQYKKEEEAYSHEQKAFQRQT